MKYRYKHVTPGFYTVELPSGRHVGILYRSPTATGEEWCVSSPDPDDSVHNDVELTSFEEAQAWTEANLVLEDDDGQTES